ncbi:heparinase II/III family protein [Dyadobacter beijingensis]|nr:alginate lyase family protein [Dyadobacter beijingensis]
MLRYLQIGWHVSRQMGWKYVLFRAGYWLQGRLSILKWRFSRTATHRVFISLENWRGSQLTFLFDPENLRVQKYPALKRLAWRVAQIGAGRFQYFSGEWFEIADWHTHPLTGYSYNPNVHWSDVDDFSAEAGDIKYVWEKSRFTFLYDLIRYDHHCGEDQSETVFGLITDWIDYNPVNCGPNWKCSQEIALRVLNWTFALHYYRRSKALSQPLLDKILCSIYDQMRHVAANIRFSQIAVRNNHVLTEALGLFVSGLMFPYFPESGRWRIEGKRIFEIEITRQIASDGTYLQFSMNYHRAVVQLLSWGIRLAELHEDRMCEAVYDRAMASITFLKNSQIETHGRLPNYGHNDGALFFPLTECHHRDFRPQLAALANVLQACLDYQKGEWEEECEWLTGNPHSPAIPVNVVTVGVSNFPTGGYHIIRDANSLTFLRCGSYYSRPFQADHNHLDIWVGGRNILRDAGTWLYNTDEAFTRYFSGTRSHNTVMIEDFDQMQKANRFIWMYWIRNAEGKSGSADREFWIESEFEGFRHLGRGIIHRRRVVKAKGRLHWLVEDHVLNVPKGLRIRQLWHPDEKFREDYQISAVDEKGCALMERTETGWHSDQYGVKVACDMLVFESYGRRIRTIIESCK